MTRKILSSIISNRATDPLKNLLELLMRVPQSLQLHSRALGFLPCNLDLNPQTILSDLRLKDLLFQDIHFILSNIKLPLGVV
jgi:hypothetical protein